MSKKTSYMLLNIQSGNAINGWIDKDEALAALDKIREEEPFAMEYLGLIEFNPEGEAVDVLFDGADEKKKAEEKKAKLAEIQASQAPQESQPSVEPDQTPSR